MALSTRISRYIRSNLLGLIAIYIALGSVAMALPGKNAVLSDDIKNGQVRAVDIGAGQVLAEEIGEGQIGTAHLADAAVTTAKLAPGSVSNGNLGNESVNSASVVDGSLTAADIDEPTLTIGWSQLQGIPAGFADGIDHEGSGGAATDLSCAAPCVQTAELANGAVTAGKVAADVATQAELNAHKTSTDHDSRYLRRTTALVVRQSGSAGQTSSAVAPCPAGLIAVGGGIEFDGFGIILRSAPSPGLNNPPTGWAGSVQNQHPDPASTVTAHAWAVCI